MKYKKILPILLLCLSPALSACQPIVPTSQPAPTVPSSVPADTKPGTASVPAPTKPVSSSASIPSASVPGSSSPSAQEETPRSVLQRSADAMLSVQSYDYTSESMTNFGESEASSQTEATVFPQQGDGRILTRQSGSETVSYLKNNRMYMLDPLKNAWVYVDMKNPAAQPAGEIHPRVNEYMALEKTKDGGYVLSSERPLSALEFYSLTGLEVQEAETLKQMEAQGQTMETMAVLVLDSAFRYKEVSYEQVTESGGLSTHTVLTYLYSNYDAAEEIVVPEDILQQAVPLDPDGQS